MASGWTAVFTNRHSGGSQIESERARGRPFWYLAAGVAEREGHAHGGHLGARVVEGKASLVLSRAIAEGARAANGAGNGDLGLHTHHGMPTRLESTTPVLVYVRMDGTKNLKK